MIPQSCPLTDKGKLHVTLHVKCVFIREGEEPFTEMCKDCPFNPEVIREKTITNDTYEYMLNYYKNVLGYATRKETKLIKNNRVV